MRSDPMRASRPPRRARAAACLLLAAAVACGGDRDAGGADSATPAGTPGTAAAPAPAVTASAGEQQYARCATCHMADGQGLANAYPPLAGSEFVTAAEPTAAIHVVLRGMQGPVTVRGTEYDGVMLPYGTSVPMTDAEVADVLTYVRQAWGNDASPVTAEQVARVRASAPETPVTAAELRSMM